MKKILLPLLTLLLALFVAGCSVGTPSNDATIPKYEDPEFGVSTKQLIADIIENETIADALYSELVEETPVEYISHEITKRQIDENSETDSIDLVLKCKNEYISGEMNVSVGYEFYDVGGWMLNYITVSSYTMTPLKAANADMIAAVISNDTQGTVRTLRYFYSEKDIDYSDSNYISTYSRNLIIVNNTFLPDENTTHLHVSFTSSCTEISGYIPVYFDPMFGWMFDLEKPSRAPVIIITNADTSKLQSLIGHYSNGHYSFEIKKIDTTNHIISYTTYVPMIGWVSEGNYTEGFDPISADFDLYGRGIHYNLSYDDSTQAWIGYGEVFKKT